MNLDALRSQLCGELLTPASTGYEGARQLWNGMIDRRPAAIARCVSAGDVAAAVRFSATEGLHPAVRAGGHNVAGLASVEDGLIIDVSSMKGIVVDPVARTAVSEMGLTWGEFDAATQAHGLATTGGRISTTGVAGLTLGGGVGWLMGRAGLTCDNTLSYSLVTADGEQITAAAETHPDLFWALKGAGGNFGAVTSITYRLHDVRTVISGMILHPLARARDVLRYYRDFVLAGLPDELTIFAAALTSADGVPRIAVIPAYTGANLDAGERLLAPLRAFGPPAGDLVGRMPYLAMQRMSDATAPRGHRCYWKSTFLRELPDAAIDAFVAGVEACPSSRTIILLEHAHGVVARIAPHETAFCARGHPFNLVVLGMWDDAEDDARNIAWARELYGAMQPWSAALVYVNALGEDDQGRVREAYGDNYPRLARVKAQYDPENRFRRTQNILPAGSRGQSR